MIPATSASGAGAVAGDAPAPDDGKDRESAPRQHDRWLECEQHLNQRLLAPLLRFYGLRFGDDALPDLAERLGTSLMVLRDPDRWFSAGLFVEILDEMARATGKPDIAQAAGRALAEPGMMGPERMLLAGFASPKAAYANLQRVSSRLSRITTWDVEIAPGGERATARVHLPDNRLDAPQFCRNRIGTLEALPEGFGLPPARVEHTRCIHDGADDCVYVVRWVERNPLLPWGWVASALAGAASIAMLLAGWTGASWLLASAAILSTGTAMGTLLSQARVAKARNDQNREELGEVQALLERNDRRIEELGAIQSVTTVAAGFQDEDDLVDAVLAELRRALGYDRALLLRVHEGGTRLGCVRSSGFGGGAPDVGAIDLAARTDRQDGRLFANILVSGQPILVRADEDYLAGLRPGHAALLRRLGSESFAAAPVMGPAVDGQREDIGLLLVDRTSRERALDLRDRDLVSSIASALGTAIAGVRSLRRVQEELLVNKKYRQYLPESAVEAIRNDPRAELRLGGQERELAILFTDIASFTATSAALPPEDVVAGLNAWFAITDPVIAQAGGIVDKRMGDGILVVFLPEQGAREGRHPAQRAAAAARNMFVELERRRSDLATRAPAFAGMEVRHAIHYGRAIVGNMGSEERKEYTVIGDAVNVCARLEEITPAGRAWVTGQAVEAVPGGLASVELVKTVTLRGRREPTSIYEILVEISDCSPSGTWSTARADGGSTASLSTEMEAPAEE